MSVSEIAALDPTADLAAALAAAQAELPDVKKNRSADVKSKEGRFLYAYAYADLADVSAAVLPVLGRHGLAFTAFPGHQPDGKFGLRYYLLHSGGGSIGGFFEIDDKGGMQIVGGRITYARRYCLCAVTGVAADEDVDARDDGAPRTAQRQSAPARRAPRNASPAPAAQSAASAAPPPAQGAGEALPPLPGEDEDPTTSGASSSAHAPDSGSQPRTGGQSPSGSDGSATTPDDTDYDTPGTATRGKGGQLTALWTILSTEFGYGDAEKSQARAVCEHIINRDLVGGTTGNLSRNEARTVLDTLSHWLHQAEKAGEHPRTYMTALMTAQDAEPTDA